MFEVFASGALGGLLLSAVVGPTDLIKCRIQDGQYAGLVEGVRDVVRRQGVMGLGRGTLATMAREIPGNAIFFTVYEALQMTFPRWVDRSPGSGTSNPDNGAERQFVLQEAVAAVACGGAAGSAFWVTMLPVDYAKTRYQIAHPGDADDVSLLRLMRRQYATRGMAGLYAGVGPVLLRAFPTNAVQFLAWEAACQAFGTRRQIG